MRDESKYLELFAPATNETRVGEASVWYLYSKDAAVEIKSFSPEASIVISLRNPVDMLHSLHSQLIFSGVEDIEDFESALRADASGRVLPFWHRRQSVAGMRYHDAGNYSKQVERYLSIFGREKVRVLIFDDLRENPLHVYRETCKFLGVTTEFEPEFRVVNPNKKVRSESLGAMIQEPPASLRALGRSVLTRSIRYSLLERLQRLNTRYEPRPSMAESLRRQLQSYFAPDVERLSELLDRDLTHWCRS